MKKVTIEIKWAIILSVTGMAWMFAERVIGLHEGNFRTQYLVTNFIIIPAALIYSLALREKKKTFYAGHMTYRQGLITGVLLTLTATILSPLAQYLTYAFITPDFLGNASEYAIQHGIMMEEAAARHFNMKSYIIQGLIGTPVMGLILSGILPLFFRTRGK